MAKYRVWDEYRSTGSGLLRLASRSPVEIEASSAEKAAEKYMLYADVGEDHAYTVYVDKADSPEGEPDFTFLGRVRHITTVTLTPKR